MPKIKPAPPAQRQAFRKTLSPARRQAFDRLAELIDDPRQNLDWHHDVGRLTMQLRPPTDKEKYHGSNWFATLAEALGPRRWFFHKAVHFVQLYPTKEAVRELKAIGVDWTRISLSFPVQDKKKRHALLRQAVKGNWTIPQFRDVMQERFRHACRGVGGRPRLAPHRRGPEACLRHAERLILALLDFHAGVWMDISAAEWRQFVKDCVGPERDRLVELLKSTERGAADLAAAGDKMRHKSSRLRAQV